MRGLPKKLNSKYDYIYIKENFPRSEWVPAWEQLVAESKNWFFTEKLAKETDGIVDDTHRVEVGKDSEGNTEYYQYELRTDQSSDMIRLGFTAAEVRTALGEVVQ